jgi:hypothetical protein
MPTIGSDGIKIEAQIICFDAFSDFAMKKKTAGFPPPS